MPVRDPFTLLCQQLARGPRFGRADLHLHTTASDGTYTPAQIVELACRAGLGAIAITDHDTLAGLEPARLAARGSTLEVIPGVEITTEFLNRELHLLGYFVDPENLELSQALHEIRRARAERFALMVDKLCAIGVPVEVDHLPAETHTLGRRHLAELLVQQGKASTVREAFQRWLARSDFTSLPKRRLPVGDALALVRGAGGVAAWAHPNYDGKAPGELPELVRLGLGALECDYPEFTRSKRLALRAMAGRLGLRVTGGSDCHGPGKREVGTCSISDEELERLRPTRGDACFAPCSTRSSKV